MTRRQVSILGLGATIALAGAACQKAEAPNPSKAPATQSAAVSKPAEAPAEGAAKKKGPSLHGHMQEHFVKADELRAAVIAGKVDDAKAAAKWIVDHDGPPDLPARFESRVATLKAAAAKVAGAEDIRVATHGAVELAAACAGCHTANDKVLEFGAEPEPEGKVGVKAHMARHRWAITRMWDGVLGGSGDVFGSGAKALAELPLLAKNLTADKRLGPGAEHLAERLHAQADKAAAAKTPQERQKVLVEVLTTCQSCHAMLGKGPGDK